MDIHGASRTLDLHVAQSFTGDKTEIKQYLQLKIRPQDFSHVIHLCVLLHECHNKAREIPISGILFNYVSRKYIVALAVAAV